MTYLGTFRRGRFDRGPSCACGHAAVHAMCARIEREMSRRGFIGGALAGAAALGLPTLAGAQSAPVPAAADRPVAIRNARVFDGRSARLREGVQVLVRGRTIEAILEAAAPLPEGTRAIDAGGRVLMPGLIDAHWHALMAAMPLPALLTADVGFVHLAAAAEAERTLLRGFTTIRDLGGPSFALKRAIDQGLLSGPRIYPSGATLSQTGGHGDFRMPHELPRADGTLSHVERMGATAIVDGPDAVRRRAREQLMLGATQVKLMAGGGVSSLYDPLDGLQFTLAETRAAVEAAEDWGAYCAAHVYTPKGIARALEAGVRSIEHGQLADEDSVRRIVDAGAWWCLQPFIADPESPSNLTDPDSIRKQQQVQVGTDAAYGWAIRHRAKVGFGTDILFAAPGGTRRQSRSLVQMTRWYAPVDVLRQATSINGELLALSGARNAYPGKLGVVEPGAWADLLVVDGDPTRDLAVLGDPQRTLRLVMKDGRVHKDTLAATN
jgi:imidazolonepropionase-like amidohydrolase